MLRLGRCERRIQDCSNCYSSPRAASGWDYIGVYIVVQGTVSITEQGTDAQFPHFCKRGSNNNRTRADKVASTN